MKNLLRAFGLITMLASATPAQPFQLYNTGLGSSGTMLPAVADDAHWMIVSGPGISGSVPATVLSDQWGYSYAQSAASRWVWANSSGEAGFGEPYVYRLIFDLGDIDPATAMITGRWGVDNVGYIRLNGITNNIGFGALALSEPVLSNFEQFHSFSLTNGFVPGQNMLEFVVIDQGVGGGFNVTDLIGATKPPVSDCQPIYTQDFSSDPNWSTSSSKPYSWNSDGTVTLTMADNSDSYAVTPVQLADGESFAFEYDIRITRMDWAADVDIGLFGPTLAAYPQAGVNPWLRIGFNRGDLGNGILVMGYDSAGTLREMGQYPSSWSLNTDYHVFVEFSKVAKTLSVLVTRKSDGAVIYADQLGNVPGFANLVHFGSSKVGDNYAAGATGIGKIDNLSLCQAAPMGNTPPVLQCPTDRTAQISETLQLKARVSDANDDPLVLVWAVNGISIQTNYLAASRSGVDVPLSLAPLPGTNIISILLSDGTNSVSCQTEVVGIQVRPLNCQPLYMQDFSSDPAWSTSAVKPYSWNSDGTITLTMADNSDSYAVAPVQIADGESFAFEYDIRVSRMDWAADVDIGLFGPTLAAYPQAGVNPWLRIGFNRGDLGHGILVMGYDSGGALREMGQYPSYWSLNTDYHVLIAFSKETKMLSVLVTRKSDGEVVYLDQLTDVPGFANLVYFGSSKVGDDYAAGATGIGKIDNLSLCQAAVADTTPPVIANIRVSAPVFFPPNHKMFPVTISADVSDDNGPATWKVLRVTSNQPVSGKGYGNTSPDWRITGNRSVQLRAERYKANRVYTITIQAEDGSGNVSEAQTTVRVPLSLSALEFRQWLHRRIQSQRD